MSFRRHTVGYYAVVLLLALTILCERCEAFVIGHGRTTTTTTPSRPTAQQQKSSSRTTSFSQLYALKQLPGESNDAYFKRLTTAASDPAAFERMVMEQEDDDEQERSDRHRYINKYHTTTPATCTGPHCINNNNDEQRQDKKKRGYQRVEDWDAEQKEKGTFAWEEKVQFDGQRYGNQYQQNEILRHNLNAF